MSLWVRLWEDMPNDPKWRVVARRAGRPVSEVLAVFLHMMTNASAAAERGNLQNWNDEDVAIAIDADPQHVAAIREAMQGKTLEGEHLTGWEKRQPKREREDNSTDRVKEHRERLKEQAAANETHRNTGETPRNATKRHETPREDKSREDTDKIDTSSLCSDGAQKPISENLGDTEPAGQQPKAKRARASARTSLSEDTQPSDRQRSDAEEAGLSTEIFRAQWRKFRDYHRSKGSLMADWDAAWRTWLGNMGTFGQTNITGLQQPTEKPGRTTNMGGGIDTASDKSLRDRLERYFRDGSWPYVTPKPGEPGCRVPDDLLPVEYRSKPPDRERETGFHVKQLAATQ